jgi:hypothetical protein
MLDRIGHAAKDFRVPGTREARYSAHRKTFISR